jgi:3-hydroxyisobutyrate dehydrogenase/2-hydroxy-3-oxopropionate reductase
MKLAVNSVVFGINQAVAEALVMAERSGVDRTVAYDVFSNSAAGAPVVNYRKDIFLHPGELPVSFTIDLAVKDLELITGHAHEVGTTLPVAEGAIAVMRAAVAAGLGHRDMGDVAVYLRDRAG